MMKVITTIVLCLSIAHSGFSQVNFESITFDEALAKAKKENKKVFVDVYTVWCGPCRRMDQRVFSNKKVGERIAKDYVAIKIENEKSPDKGKMLQYKIKGYPTMLVLNPEGKELGRIYGSRTLDGFHKELDNFLPEEERPLFKALKAMKDNPDDEMLWREKMTFLSENGHYTEFNESCQKYADQFGLKRIKDDLDQQIFDIAILPLDNPVVVKYMSTKKNYGLYKHQDYKVMEWQQRARGADKSEIKVIEEELKVYHDDLMTIFHGDIHGIEYFSEQIFKKEDVDEGPEKVKVDSPKPGKEEDKKAKRKKTKKKKDKKKKKRKPRFL